MKVGVVGLGKMGEAVAYRFLLAGHAVTGFDKNEQACQSAEKNGVHIVKDLKELAAANRIIWLMIPAGEIVDFVIKELVPHLKEGDIIVDGGNSHFPDTQRRAEMLQAYGILFVDCGTSGGLFGRAQGFSLMVGGDRGAYTKIHPLLTALAAPGGVAHVGPSGAGHYVKMVHNGIEYGVMQAYAEGFSLIKNGSFKEEVLDLQEISRVWQHGSIIRSYLLDLAHEVFRKDQELHRISGEVAEGGTGLWTVEDAQEHDVAMPVIASTLNTREWSRETGGNYMTKIIAMLRKEFGGHLVEKVQKKEKIEKKDAQ